MQKRINQIVSVAVVMIALLSVVFYFPSCKKNTDCKATISVTDASTGAPVWGAIVTVGPSQTAPQGNLSIQTQTQTTDGSGSASFTFKLPAILSVYVQTPNPPYSGTVFGNNLIQLEVGKTVTKTISVN